ncbi:hypothetical protein ACFVVM_26610 [Nocardia sp. NPDC058176]|uniref:hypothetical protein n=1 Tax=Nocardia sp. NPDC058176 TaxID=3346368 RepID=UPI0036DAC64E
MTRSTIRRSAVAIAGLTAAVLVSAPNTAADPGSFRITGAVPTLAELNEQIRFLVETPASDAAKAANLEGGANAVVVPRTVYNLGLFRAPLGWNEVTGPETHSGTEHTAVLHASSAGRPTVTMRITWKRVDGTWKLANKSLCAGVKTVGLPIPCDF